MINIIKKIIVSLPFIDGYFKIKSTKQQPRFVEYLCFRLGLSKIYWPVHKDCVITGAKKIFVGKNSLVGRKGCYLSGPGGIYIGDYVEFAMNVGVLSSNHDLYDQNKHNRKPIIIGDYCWLGMNSIILAGITLGTRTIVAAGAVVTKSFPEGFCVIGGNPAKVIKYLDREKFIPYKYEYEYYGFIPKRTFDKMRDKYITRFEETLLK